MDKLKKPANTLDLNEIDADEARIEAEKAAKEAP
jgi:hypothetical protein